MFFAIVVFSGIHQCFLPPTFHAIRYQQISSFSKLTDQYTLIEQSVNHAMWEVALHYSNKVVI